MVLHFLKMFSKILCSAVSSTPAYAVLYRVLIITLEHHEGNNGVSNILSEGHLLGKRLQNRLVFTYIRLCQVILRHPTILPAATSASVSDTAVHLSRCK